MNKVKDITKRPGFSLAMVILLVGVVYLLISQFSNQANAQVLDVSTNDAAVSLINKSNDAITLPTSTSHQDLHKMK